MKRYRTVVANFMIGMSVNVLSQEAGIWKISLLNIHIYIRYRYVNSILICIRQKTTSLMNQLL